MKFLIIEDDKTAQMLLQQITVNYGTYDVASNGIEALELLNSNGHNNYDVIFLDIMMPEMDGLEFLEKLRNIEKEKNFPHKKVIIISALEAEKTIIPQFIQDKDLTYLVKPINRAVITEILDNFSTKN